MKSATKPAPSPSVGDPIAIELPRGPVTIEPSPDFEIVSRFGSRVVVRTFRPKAFTLKGTAGGRPFTRTIGVRSVLKPDDDLAPAPLRAPLAEPAPRLPWILIVIAGVLAIVAWTMVVLRRSRHVETIEVPLTPTLRFHAAVRAASASPRRWSGLADALRDYLAEAADLPLDLTTTQLLALANDATIADVLHQGDLEKFSPWGARRMDFDDVARRAMALAQEPEREVAA